MSSECIRKATVADLPGIIDLLVDDDLGAQREVNGPEVDARYTAAFAAIARDPNQDVIVMEMSGRIVGCLQLSFLQGLSHRGMVRGQVESVRIAGDLRGQGLGHKLMDWAIGACRDRGCGVIQLTTTKSRAEAQRFYESLGFVKSHEGMKLPLKTAQ